MERWKRLEMHKCMDNYNQTGDVEHLEDILRIMLYDKQEAEYRIFLDNIKSRVGARLKRSLQKLITSKLYRKLLLLTIGGCRKR